jgi:hypothetical protein
LISLIPLHANGNLEFISTKCKFVIVGKRTDKHKQWSLGNDKIGEDNNLYIKFSAHDTLLEFKYLSYDSEDPCGTPMSNSGA